MIVTLNDKNIPYSQLHSHFKTIALWAQQNCLSFRGYELLDVSDFSYEYDMVAQYEFADNKDATLFKLKWS